MKKTLLSAASSIGIVTAALLFTGCGDSDSSSSPSSTAGTQTGQFVKGKWKGISYTRSNGVSGTTGDNGTFTYNLGENVTFDFGLGKAIWASGSTTGNSTAPASVSVLVCSNPASGAGWTANEAATVTAVMNAYGVTESTTSDLTTFINNVRTKAAGVNITALAKAGQANVTSLINDTLGNITGAPANANASEANLGDALAAVIAAQMPTTNVTGNATTLLNKKILLANGTTVTPTGSTGNYTLTTAGGNYRILGKLTGGTALMDESNVTSNIKAVAYNLSSIGGDLSGYNISVSVDGKNRTYSFVTNTSYTLKVDGTSSVNGTYKITSDGLGLNLYPSNTTTGGADATVTFEDEPATVGTIAKIWSVVSALSASMTEVVYSTVTKVLAALH